MTDKEAIGRIQEHIYIHSKKEPFTPYLDEAFAMVIEALKDRPHGEWIEKYQWKFKYYCSHCGSGADRKGRFCDCCGSDNRPRENTSSSMIINGKYSENVEYGTRVEIDY